MCSIRVFEHNSVYNEWASFIQIIQLSEHFPDLAGTQVFGSETVFTTIQAPD